MASSGDRLRFIGRLPLADDAPPEARADALAVWFAAAVSETEPLWGRLTGAIDWPTSLDADVRGDALFLQRAALFALFDLLWALESAQTPADAALPSGATWKLGVLRDQLHARYEADGPNSDSAADFDELLDALDGLGDRVARVEAMAPDGGSAVAAVLREAGLAHGVSRAAHLAAAVQRRVDEAALATQTWDGRTISAGFRPTHADYPFDSLLGLDLHTLRQSTCPTLRDLGGAANSALYRDCLAHIVFPRMLLHTSPSLQRECPLSDTQAERAVVLYVFFLWAVRRPHPLDVHDLRPAASARTQGLILRRLRQFRDGEWAVLLRDLIDDRMVSGAISAMPPPPGVAPLPMHAAPARARDPPSRPGETRALQLRTDAVAKAHIEGHIRKAFDIATRRDASVRASSESDLELLRQKCQALNPPRLAPHAGFQIQAVPDDYAQTRVCDYTDEAIAAAPLRLPRGRGMGAFSIPLEAESDLFCDATHPVYMRWRLRSSASSSRARTSLPPGGSSARRRCRCRC